VGLEHALETGDEQAIDDAIKLILLLHGMILSFGGIPLLYYGDALGTLNDDSFRNDPHKQGDTRWVHRPAIDWEQAALRNTPGTVEYKIFSALKRMIAIRKEIQVFADFNNRELLEVENPHLFVFGRYSLNKGTERVLVAANFHSKPQHLNLQEIGAWAPQYGQLVDLHRGESPDTFNGSLVIPGFGFYWLCEK
jgi:amylosucrase